MNPTMRMHIVAPVTSLQSAITGNHSLMLAWKPADDDIIGYFIYKLDTLDKKYYKITPLPVTDTHFEDTVPVAGNNYYMVKTYKLTQAASGSFYNLSQGIFDTVYYTVQDRVAVSGISLILHPASTLPLNIHETFLIDAIIAPSNATNKLLKWSVENNVGSGRFDASGNVFPEKAGVFTATAEALDGSGVKGRLEILVDSIPDAAGTISGGTNLCMDRKRKYYSVPDIRGASDYIWTLPDGTVDTSIVNETMITCDSDFVSGNISVAGHNIYGDGNKSTIPVTINELPPKPSITLDGNVLHSSAQSGNQWYINKDMIPTATDTMYIPVQEGRYYAKVTLNSCTSLMSNIIDYQPTGIESNSSRKQIMVYPNPSSGLLMVSFGIDPVRRAAIRVFDIQGNLFYSVVVQHTTQAIIELNGAQEGIYMIKVFTDKNNYNGKVYLELK
jgi:hypothetical protein